MWYWNNTNLLCYPIVKVRTLMVLVSVCPQTIWKGNATGTRSKHFLWTAFFQEHPKNRGCQSCEPNDNSVGSEPLGLLPPDENSFVKRKSYSGRSKWTSKCEQPLSICLWPEVENVENCWNNITSLQLLPLRTWNNYCKKYNLHFLLTLFSIREPSDG